MPASPDRADLGAALARAIAADGPMPLERFTAAANAFYYATHDPFGAGGDFVTAPEVSQMFGELVGLALADLWMRAGRPPAYYVELGPGRGTLAADAVRAMARAGLRPPVHLVETSARLRAAQARRVGGATWHDDLLTLPADGALLIVANEFFDALPVRQLVRTEAGWRARAVAAAAGGFALVADAAPAEEEVPHGLRDLPAGSVIERRPAAEALVAALAARLAAQGGLLLAIDYGHAATAPGDTLQAVRGHAFADPLARPGASDLTAHVDFAALASPARAAGLRVLGPVEQGQWLTALGLSDRAAALARAHPARADELAVAYRRLVDPAEMGRLFKVLAAVAPAWPNPAGFG